MSEENFKDFGDQTKKINLALNFTDGDLDKAKEMVAGHYNDIKILKGKISFNDRESAGQFFLAINYNKKKVLYQNSLFSSDPSFSNSINIFDEWGIFYNSFSNFAEEFQNSLINEDSFLSHLASSVDGYDLYEEIRTNNLDFLTETLKEIISKFFDNHEISCKLDITDTSSLNLIDKGIKISAPKEEKPASEEDFLLSSVMQEIENEADLVISCQIIVSPVKGKYIAQIKAGEIINILPEKKDPTITKIAKSLNCLSEDNEVTPMPARVKAKQALPDNKGWLIYAMLGKNVVAKIIEEENVKISIPQNQNKNPKGTQEKEIEKSTSKIIILISLFFGLILVAGMIILFVAQ